MNRIVFFAIASTLPAAAFVAPAHSQQIVVTSDRSVAAFIEEVSTNLDRELARTYVPARSSPSGYAIVRFERGEDGRPENVTLFRSARDREVNRIARRAVARLPSLHPLPGELREGQQLQANIVIANSEESYERLAGRLRRSEEQRIASAGKPNAVLAFSARAGAKS